MKIHVLDEPMSLSAFTEFQLANMEKMKLWLASQPPEDEYHHIHRRAHDCDASGKIQRE
jgi:hypothetical protein